MELTWQDNKVIYDPDNLTVEDVQTALGFYQLFLNAYIVSKENPIAEMGELMKRHQKSIWATIVKVVKANKEITDIEEKKRIISTAPFSMYRKWEEIEKDFFDGINMQSIPSLFLVSTLAEASRLTMDIEKWIGIVTSVINLKEKGLNAEQFLSDLMNQQFGGFAMATPSHGKKS